MKFLNSIIVLTMLAPNSFALDQKSCTDIELREQVGPIRNQGDVGWCYANASADLLTAFYKSKNQGFMSAIQLAMIYNNSYEESLTAQGGDIADTLKVALRLVHTGESSSELLKVGYCPNSLELEAMTTGPKTPLSTKIKRLNELKALFDLGKSNPLSKKQFWDLYLGYRAQGSILAKIPEATFIQALEKSNPGNFLLRFADIICGEIRVYNDRPDIKLVQHSKSIPMTFTYPKGPSCSTNINFDLIPDIHRELQNGRLVGVGFYASLIVNPGLSPDGLSGHAAVIVGRRWRSGACQLEMRNSWGTDG